MGQSPVQEGLLNITVCSQFVHHITNKHKTQNTRDVYRQFAVSERVSRTTCSQQSVQKYSVVMLQLFSSVWGVTEATVTRSSVRLAQ
jgi:3-methyladenine DNA glycosylase Tag